MSSNRKGWHPGETAIHSQLQYTEAVADAFELIAGVLPEAHRAAHSELNLLPIVTLDPQARPWVSVVTSPTGNPGFVRSVTEHGMAVEVTLWDGDPLCETTLQTTQTESSSKILIAGIGVRLDSVLARNKFSGSIEKFTKTGKTCSMVLEVNQALSHTTRYMTIRSLYPHPDTSPVVGFRNLNLQPAERLPVEVINFIQASDTAFLGTSYVAVKRDEKRFPSHLGLNHRGGRPGFLRVRPSDGKTIVFPDFSGNRLMNSLGNIEATPVAALTIPCFTSGDILYLTGTARNFVGKRAQALMHRVNVLSTIKVTGYIFVRGALPIRQHGDKVVRSPYIPPVRFLSEEKPGQIHYKDACVVIKQVVFKNQDIATFTFEASQQIPIKPGEWAMLDFTSFVRRPQGTAMSADIVSRHRNDDLIRTWTISSCHQAASRTFEITMQRKDDGLVTPALFDVAHRLVEGTSDTASSLKGEMQGSIRLVSIGGEFVLSEANQKLLWIAGGIGVTPFMSILKALQQGQAQLDISLLIASQLPDLHMSLITSSLFSDPSQRSNVHITIHVYSSTAPSTESPPDVDVYHHIGRFQRASLGLAVPDVAERAVWICAPSQLSELVMEGLIEAEVDLDSVRRESFMW